MNKRWTREQVLIETTKLEAKRGTCLRAQVGCVIAIEGRVIATGYNGAPPGEPHCIDVGCQMEEGHCVRTIHAEANAVCWAARRGVSVLGATMYTYGWSGGICHRCEKLSKSAGVIKIVEIPFEETRPLTNNLRLHIEELIRIKQRLECFPLSLDDLSFLLKNLQAVITRLSQL
jgi:dCMP deaminase